MAEPCRENCPRSWATVLAIALTLAACGATTEIDAAADASPEALPDPLPGGLVAPALLRIGGSEADVVAYDLSDTPPEQAAEPFELLFTKAQWAGIDAPDLLSATVLLNGVELAAAADGSLPPLVAETLPRADGAAWVRLPPTSVAFVRVPAVEAPARGR